MSNGAVATQNATTEPASSAGSLQDKHLVAVRAIDEQPIEQLPSVAKEWRDYDAAHEAALADLEARGIAPKHFKLFEEAMYDWELQHDVTPIPKGAAAFAAADRLFRGKDVERKVERRAKQYAKMVDKVRAAGFATHDDPALEDAVYAVNQWRKWRDRGDVERKDYAPFFRQRPLKAMLEKGIDPKDFLNS